MPLNCNAQFQTQYLRSTQSMINHFLKYVSIFQLELTHSATPPKRSEGFKFTKCSYGPTTTQQQAHNRTPAGFKILSNNNSSQHHTQN